MTKLSVNINKIALIRNSRGRDYPSVREFAEACLKLGAHGITLHPRPDQRHARYSDVVDLKTLCDRYAVELNVEGYPTEKFLEVVETVKPAQCTLVPDSPDQITSDHGWNFVEQRGLLGSIIKRLKQADVRVSVFTDYDCPDIALAKALGADRIELYTEPHAETFGKNENEAIFQGFKNAEATARSLGLGVNAGHGLNLENLGKFLTIPDILEVSIGHALLVESIEQGLRDVIRKYLEIVNQAA